MWSNRNCLSLLVGTQNGTATLEAGQLLIKLNKLLPYNLGITLLDIHPKEQNLGTYKNLHMDSYSSSSHDCQDLEATKMPSGGWTGKQTVLHPDNGTLFGTRKK